MYSEGTYNYLLSVQATLAAEGVTVDPTQPVHPTFLYESIWCLVGFVLLASHIKSAALTANCFCSTSSGTAWAATGSRVCAPMR